MHWNQFIPSPTPDSYLDLDHPAVHHINRNLIIDCLGTKGYFVYNRVINFPSTIMAGETMWVKR